MFLADINFWLALAFQSHPKHVSAKGWFDRQADDSVFFCRMTQQGMLRLATYRPIFKDEAVTMIVAWAIYDAFVDDPKVAVFEGEPIGIELEWRNITSRSTFSPKVWSDAWLAAFAKAAGLRVVTFDRGFAQYQGIQCVILS